jgi:ectoine hydroxylase-related dioxygenase (phytanoyl-CoA dioxygenase family)
MSVEKELTISYTDELLNQGVLVFRNKIAASHIATLQAEIGKIRQKVMAKISGMPRPLANYVDIAERQLGRLDYRCGFTASIFQEVEVPIVNLIKELSPTINFKHYWGVIASQPGAAPTDIHRDVYPILNTSMGYDISMHDLSLPPYYFSVFIPMVKLTMENGPTQFVKQSNKKGVVDQTTVKLLTPLPEPGDFIVMDGRTLHRGLANTTQEERTIAYITFVAKWYHDQSFGKTNSYLFE